MTDLKSEFQRVVRVRQVEQQERLVADNEGKRVVWRRRRVRLHLRERQVRRNVAQRQQTQHFPLPVVYRYLMGTGEMEE